jgi:hypothetical protein
MEPDVSKLLALRKDLTFECPKCDEPHDERLEVYQVTFTCGNARTAQLVVSAVAAKIIDATDAERRKTAQRASEAAEQATYNAAHANEIAINNGVTDWDHVHGSPLYKWQKKPPLDPERFNLSNSFEVQLLDPATLPEVPDSPRRWVLALAGLAAGIVIGSGTLAPPRSV